MYSADLLEIVLIDFDSAHEEGYMLRGGSRKGGTSGWTAQDRGFDVVKEWDTYALTRLVEVLDDPKAAKAIPAF